MLGKRHRSENCFMKQCFQITALRLFCLTFLTFQDVLNFRSSSLLTYKWVASDLTKDKELKKRLTADVVRWTCDGIYTFMKYTLDEYKDPAKAETHPLHGELLTTTAKEHISMIFICSLEIGDAMCTAYTTETQGEFVDKYKWVNALPSMNSKDMIKRLDLFDVPKEDRYLKEWDPFQDRFEIKFPNVSRYVHQALLQKLPCRFIFYYRRNKSDHVTGVKTSLFKPPNIQTRIPCFVLQQDPSPNNITKRTFHASLNLSFLLDCMK